MREERFRTSRVSQEAVQERRTIAQTSARLNLSPGDTFKMDSLDAQIDQFLSAPAFGVAGASDDKHKYGHKVLVCYLQHDRKAYAINPNVETVLGNTSYPNVSALPEKIESLSIITPPHVTETVVDDAIAAGVKNIWMQPGAESHKAIAKAKEAGVNVISGGACLLVVLGYRGP
jgi:predicted CoA-binding protein